MSNIKNRFQSNLSEKYDEYDKSWSPEVEEILIELHRKATKLSGVHSVKYYSYEKQNQYFDLPVIIISTISATFTVVAPVFMRQIFVTVASACILMAITILTSIKIYLALETKLKNEDTMGTAFGTLSLNLSRILKLAKWQRNGNGLEYSNKMYSEYIKLIESSALPRNGDDHGFLFCFPSKLEHNKSIREFEHHIDRHSIDRPADEEQGL